VKRDRREESILKKNKRGRNRRTAWLKLLEVFVKKREEIMKFMYREEVPFDNNVAERDLRMIKVKQKISGCFRTKRGGEMFCRIRSYISTIRKQRYNVLNAIERALNGQPISCYLPT